MNKETPAAHAQESPTPEEAMSDVAKQFMERCKAMAADGTLNDFVDRFNSAKLNVRTTEPRHIPKEKGVYVASRASIPERGQMWRNLRDSGVAISSTWINEDGDGQTADFGELWTRIESEVKNSSALILYVEAEDLPLKGALIECGMAIAFGLPIFVVAPDVRFDARTLRPIGSWLNHPSVAFARSIPLALAELTERLRATAVPTQPTEPRHQSWEAFTSVVEERLSANTTNGADLRFALERVKDLEASLWEAKGLIEVYRNAQSGTATAPAAAEEQSKTGWIGVPHIEGCALDKDHRGRCMSEDERKAAELADQRKRDIAQLAEKLYVQDSDMTAAKSIAAATDFFTELNKWSGQ